MKIHITNLYNFNPGDALVKKQHRIAEAGFTMDYREMGIFSFPVETDTGAELSKRIDGIIAALEAEDVVFLQLPTRNGIGYERLLAGKCKAYRNTKLILIIHDMQLLSEGSDTKDAYISLCQMADAVIVPMGEKTEHLSAEGISNIIEMDDLLTEEHDTTSDDPAYLALRRSDFYIKKALMNAVAAVFAQQKELALAKAREAEEEIHIGFGLHDKNGDYSVWVGVTMQSVLEHTSAPVCFHILHDATLTQSNKEKLIQVATQGGNRVEIHHLDDSLWKKYEKQVGRFSVGTLFRIMLPELLPDLSKIIYLDADLLVNRDIKELWDIDIRKYCLAAVPDYGTINGLASPHPVLNKDVDSSKYFNTGVLYMNMDRIREKGKIVEGVLTYLENNQDSTFPDQDALNVLYKDSTLLLHESWNSFARVLRNTLDSKLEERIYHYASTVLLLYSMSPIDREYYETLCRTPWGSEEGPKQLYKAFFRTDDRLKQLEKLTHLISSSNKKYIFYGQETGAMRNLYTMLAPRDGDYRVLGDGTEEANSVLPCRPFSDLAKETEAFVVFVLPEADGWTAIEKLEGLGLKRETDYFVIPCLLSPERGGYV